MGGPTLARMASPPRYNGSAQNGQATTAPRLVLLRVRERCKEVRDSSNGIVGIGEVPCSTGRGWIQSAAEVAIRRDRDEQMTWFDLDPHDAYARLGLTRRHNRILDRCCHLSVVLAFRDIRYPMPAAEVDRKP